MEAVVIVQEALSDSECIFSNPSKWLRKIVMDKSWIHLPRVSYAYLNGAAKFLDFAFANASNRGRIRCPCKNCNNNFWVSREVAYDHIMCDGFNTSYTYWRFHGEDTFSSMPITTNVTGDNPDPHDDMHGLLYDAFGFSNLNGQESDAGHAPYGPTQGQNTKAQQFFKLLEDADQELYPGYKKFTKLSFVVKLYHIKCLVRWSDKSFTMLLELLKEGLPEGETLPKSFYETKKIISELGLKYNKIDACPNACMLYWKNGMPVDEASSRAMEQLNERTSQQPEASHNSTTRKDVFSEVMGDERHGRVRTYGCFS
ncbi:uncharacterized protein LOC131221354 isoform X2 [Magnolia sinica]|uniref:uncharacterized protein LOC131221354 isoform X2 n=1 Tax=Magnolia sinica TaxID=86752 RepID=UPI00265990F4|nr:uncharacterized protein LOC131221354 isoform X2 [Magnolia sinica]